MQTDLEDFKTGWYGLTLGINSHEIDELILALKNLKKGKGHFHLSSNYEGKGGIGDIELYYMTERKESNMVLDMSPTIHTYK